MQQEKLVVIQQILQGVLKVEKKLAKVTDGLIYKHYSQARHDQ
jgi:hypothetical protein